MASRRKSAPPPTRQPALRIESLLERPVIAIFGRAYEMRHPDELSLADRLRILHWADRTQQLAGEIVRAVEDPAREAEAQTMSAELSALLDRQVRVMLLDVPDAVHAQLTDDHRTAISLHFSRLLSQRVLRGAVAMTMTPTGETVTARPTATTETRIGVRSSPGSSGSTGATPLGGGSVSPLP